MPPAHLWHLWPGRHWPLLQDEEAKFVAVLADRSEDRTPEFDRGHLTAVLNALRCGMEAEELLKVAPGLDPAGLHAAYQYVDHKRIQSVEAWEAIVADPSPSTVKKYKRLAERLIPVAIREVHECVEGDKEFLLNKIVAEIQNRSVRAQQDASEVENLLQRCLPPSEEGVNLGRLLYDPYDPQLWGSPYFIPPRVGCLMPMRVVDLLGESRP